MVKQVHELYEQLGRQNVRAVEEWEKAQLETRKDETTAGPKPEVTAEPEKSRTNEAKPVAKVIEPEPEIAPESQPLPTAEIKPEATAVPKKPITTQHKKWLIAAVAVVILVGLGIAAWLIFGKEDKNKGLASGNGRIEAVEIGVAAKIAGRVKDILVREGELVAAGQVVALMDTEVLEAQHRQAEAQLRQAQSSVETTRSQLVQRGSEKEAVLALVRQREAELGVARKRAVRSSTLASEAATSQQEADDDSARVQSAVAAVSAARAQLAAAGATVVTAHAEIAGAQSAVEAARATVDRIQADIKDSALKSPREGRVQYRVAQPGEVVGVGGQVLNLVDLSDVYMTFFLPTAVVGRVALGTEVRLILDAAPRNVIPAQVSFVADVAQFTPKTVETASERLKLMFRVRARISPDLLRKHIMQVKTGLPGMAYLRLDPTARWPDHLQIKPQP
ncbi:MAG: HlyD family efflux transporter periplasmic adaptor subunit [Desulfuromonadales bacterium]|nr:HlyD family efflux transporter periplasmic adaptor subunit [Desulfuromonadales bacterium]